MTGGLSPNAVLKLYLFTVTLYHDVGSTVSSVPSTPTPWPCRQPDGAGHSAPAGKLCVARGRELPQ